MTVPPQTPAKASSPYAAGSPPRGDPALFPLASGAWTVPHWEREDPFTDTWMWRVKPLFTARYRPHLTVDEELCARYEPAYVYDNPDDDEHKLAWARTLDNERMHRVLTVLARLHYATSKQLATWVGFGLRDASKYLKPLFDFGLVRRGFYVTPQRVPGKLPYLYALNDDRPLRRWFKERQQLDAERGETVCRDILGNSERAFRAGSHHVRHDVMAVELMLRILETQPDIVAVAGETDATPARTTGWSTAPTFPGDAVLYRADGLKIIIEVAGTRDLRHLRPKVARWAGWFASAPFDQTGTVLVIINSNSHDHTRLATDLRRLHREVLAPGTLKHLDGHIATAQEVQRARRQIMFASWADWFPRPRRISIPGSDLTAVASPDGAQWLPVRLSKPIDWPNPAGQTDPYRVTSKLLVPPWCGDLPVNSSGP